MANSIVSLIEIFFSNTIDKMKKERSNLDGPKPILLETQNLELLFYILFGEEILKKNEEDGLLTKPPLEFGCSQVILVRDQESKNHIPSILKHALCLTIYEAKVN